MARLKALLVGVTEHATRTYEAVGNNGACRLVSSDMPSAERDVDNILRVLCRDEFETKYASILYKRLTGRLPAPDEAYLDARTTKRQNILNEIQNWLFKDVQPGDQLLFYFSGHSIQFKTKVNNVEVIKEALCPSDTDWKSEQTCITEADLFCPQAYAAMALGACLEVVLETCSASAFANPGTLNVLPFACFAGTLPTAKNASVWSASKTGEYSHSGPYPACSAEPLRGLFTQFFRDEFPGRNRQLLLNEIKRRLDAYRSAFNSCCEGTSKMTDQTPKLYSQDPNALPLWKSCGALSEIQGSGVGGTVAAGSATATSTTVGCSDPLYPNT